jgi:hypothetical protein
MTKVWNVISYMMIVVCEVHLCVCSQVCHWQGVQTPHQVVRACYVRCAGVSYPSVAIWTNTCELTRWQQMTESWTTQNLPKCLSSQWTTFRHDMPLAVEASDLLPAIRPSHNSHQMKEAQQRVTQMCLWIHSRTHLNPTTTNCERVRQYMATAFKTLISEIWVTVQYGHKVPLGFQGNMILKVQ